MIGGEWDIAGLAKRIYDRGKTIGISGAGQIGQLIASRLKPFDVKMLYYKRTPHPRRGIQLSRLSNQFSVHQMSYRNPNHPGHVVHIEVGNSYIFD